MAAYPEQHVLGVVHGRAQETAMPIAVTELESVYRQHHTRVLRLAYRITGSASDAEDVVQTVFLRLVRAGFRASDAEAYSRYLTRATVNAALDVLRSRTQAGLVPLDEASEPRTSRGTSPEANQQGRELRRQLRSALAVLSPRSAGMFVLRYLDGYSNAEVARAMNTSQAVVAVMLFRARARLRRELSAFAGERHEKPQS